MTAEQTFALIAKVQKTYAKFFWLGWAFGTGGMGVVAFIVMHLKAACV